MIMRILLLLSLAWLAHLTTPLVTVWAYEISGRDIILLLGGLFLMAKSTHEIHDKLEGQEGAVSARLVPTFGAVIVQIVLLDIVFSIDSVVTAIGMSRHVPVMVAAVMISVVAMMLFAGPISAFVERHPTVKMLALSFLLLIGVSLVADSLGFHIPRGYIYFAMAFSTIVEVFNIFVRSRRSKAKGAPPAH